MTNADLPKPDLSRRPSPWRNLSAIWLVPLAALIVSLGIAWFNFSNRGPIITIHFQRATGVNPGETQVKFRDVTIGTVEHIRFAPDMESVVLYARIDKDVAATIPPDAQFWVVSPKVSAQGITGLSTVLSGVYIEGAWSPATSNVARDFEGLSEPPVVQPDRPGTTVTIRSREGTSLPEGAPVFLHGIEVGRLDKPRLTKAGDMAEVSAFIAAPNDRFLTSATRFWDTSGFSVSLGTSGLNLSVASIGALLTGGVAFDNVVNNGDPITPSTVFDLFPDEATARQSVLDPLGENALKVSVVFSGTVGGLQADAPVAYEGLSVGKVQRVSAFLDQTPQGRVVRMRAIIDIDPQALGLPSGQGPAEALSFLKEAVGKGLRAKLVTASLFSGSLKVQLVQEENAAPALIGTDVDGLPLLPSVEADIPKFTATAEGVLERINQLPLEEVLDQAVSLMKSIEDVASAPSTREVPDKLAALLQDARNVVSQDDVKALPGELRQAIEELRSTVEEIRKQQVADKLAKVLESIDTTATNVGEASKQFPQLMDEFRSLVAKAQALKAEELIAQVTDLVSNADKVVDTDAARELPADLSKVLKELKDSLAELREGGAVDNVNAALQSARTAADDVSKATEKLPELADRLDSLVTKAEAAIATYGKNSQFNEQTLQALQEIRNAARAVGQLSRQLERNPSSLLLGR